jgi:hypothetical protein
LLFSLERAQLLDNVACDAMNVFVLQVLVKPGKDLLVASLRALQHAREPRVKTSPPATR